jgi:type II secretory pathway pseudopilin PulG
VKALHDTRGFTLAETCVATAIFVTILFAGVTVSRTAMTAAGVAIASDSTAARVESAADHVRDELVDASLATLQAVPRGGKVAENMQDGVAYDNLSFRRVTGVSTGAPLYAPPIGKPAQRFFVGVDARGAKVLEFDHGASTTVLVSDVASATFTKSGSQILVQLSVSATRSHPAAALAAAFRLIVP